MRGTGFMIFVLMMSLILVVYYVGASTDFAAFANGSRSIIYALTGRNAQGNFVNYPSGASMPQGVL